MGGQTHKSEAEAEQLLGLLRTLIRRVYSLDPDDPSGELPVAQVRVCALLYEGSRTVSALAKELGISVSAVTQVADRLEAAGLVERTADEGDRRVRHLAVTRQGAELTRRRRARRLRSAQDLLAKLAPQEQEAVLSALSALAGRLSGVGADGA